MIKKILSTVLLFMLVVVSDTNAQENVLNTKYRDYRIRMNIDGNANNFFEINTAFDDSAKINGNWYYRLNCVLVPDAYASEAGKNILYRSDEHKTYIYDEETDKDVLMFDYSLNEGDAFINSRGEKFKVVETGVFNDVVKYWNFQYLGKMLRLQSIENATLEDIWVEGLGSIYTGLLPSNLIDNPVSDYSVETCNFGSVAAIFPQNTTDYKSVPFKPYADIDDDSIERAMVNFEFSVDTLHISGIEMFNGYTYLLVCDIKNSNIDVWTYPILYYGRDLIEGESLKKFDVKIPGFIKGTYTITYFGENPMTIECNPTTDINNHIVTGRKNNQITNLIGQRLLKPQKGLNIINGRIIFVK